MINQSNAVGIKGVSRAILTAVVTVIVAIIFLATTAFADMTAQYNVEVVVENDSVVITTNETEPITILSQANVTLADSDKLDISQFIAGEGGIIKIDKLNSINIEFNGAINNYSVYANNVEDALNELGITLAADSKLNYELTDAVKDGMVITIHSPKAVSLTVDGKTTKYAIYQGTVSDLLALAQVTLGDDDFTSPAENTELKENMQVKVNRVEFKKVTKKESVAYSTRSENDGSMTAGTTKVVTKGVKGEAEVTYKVKYVNGKEDSKTELSRKVTKKPTSKVVKVGTKKTSGASGVKSNGVTSKNGFSVGQKITGKYTHYCACATCNGNGRGITASGKKITNGMANPYYIACNWLPLGSVINVDGTNYTVVDRGGSGLSTVGRIDIFTPEGHKACYKYGTGKCSIEIVRLGW